MADTIYTLAKETRPMKSLPEYLTEAATSPYSCGYATLAEAWAEHDRAELIAEAQALYLSDLYDENESDIIREWWLTYAWSEWQQDGADAIITTPAQIDAWATEWFHDGGYKRLGYNAPPMRHTARAMGSIKAAA